jgi:tetratricopeptide (TPR) repeat protein
MYQKAIELDPNFALAFARLCRAHLTMYWFYHDHSPERLTKAREAMDAAVRVAPDLSEVYLAQGYFHYWGMRDFDQALDKFKKAQESQPSNSSLLSAIGFIQRRQGKWQEALANIQKASELDPRTALLAYELGNTHMFMRNYLEAELYFDRAIWLAPTWVEAYAYKAQVCLLRDGNSVSAVRVFHNAAEKVDVGSMVTENALLCVFIDFCGRDFNKVQEKLSVDETEMELYFLRKAQACMLMGVPEQAKSYFDSARVLLETKIRANPDDTRFLSHLGLVYAGLGRKEDALRVGDKAMNLFPITRDSVSSAIYAEIMALICTMVGEYDKAIFILEFLLSVPSPVSKPYLRYLPYYKPLNDFPRFKKLISPQ